MKEKSKYEGMDKYVVDLWEKVFVEPVEEMEQEREEDKKEQKRQNIRNGAFWFLMIFIALIFILGLCGAMIFGIMKIVGV